MPIRALIQIVAQGKRKLELYIADLMQEPEEHKLSARVRLLVTDLQAQWRELDRRIAAFETEFVVYAKETDEARRLASALCRTTQLKSSASTPNPPIVASAVAR